MNSCESRNPAFDYAASRVAWPFLATPRDLAILALLGALPWKPATAAPGDARLKRTEAEWSHDGLRRAKVSGLDLVYAREGATLAGYDKVWLRGVDVAFRRDWRQSPQPGSRIVAGDVSRIKDGLAKILRDELGRELARGGYALADGPGAGVLELDAAIVDLYINAPDTSLSTAGRVRSYTVDPGHMTLAADFRDGESDALLAHVIDRKEGVDRGYLQIANSVTNTAEARRAMQQWARAIREALDAARAMAPAAGGR